MIYMDNAATTQLSAEVFEAIKPYFIDNFGNPSSVHSFGRAARKAIENARRRVANYMGCEAREIYFTSGGSEADSWALMSSAEGAKGRRTLIVSAIEHKAVLNAAAWLGVRGFNVKYLPVDEHGITDPKRLDAIIDDDTFLVSVMAANNEVGSVQPIDELCRIAHSRGALFHTDAVQAICDFDWKLCKRDIDMLSLSGHKLHAPKGVGALYIRDSIRPGSLIFGGAQERGRRGGTENVTGIVGLGMAIELIERDKDEISNKKRALTKRLEDGILSEVEGTRVNGPGANERVSGIVNIEFDGVDGEALLFNLDLKGVAVSAGSACTSGSLDASHVLLAMNRTREQAHASVRFSLSRYNTEDEVDKVVEITKDLVKKLRGSKHE